MQYDYFECFNQKNVISGFKISSPRNKGTNLNYQRVKIFLLNTKLYLKMVGWQKVMITDYN